MRMGRRNGQKKPLAFYIIFLVAIIVSIAVSIALPIELHPIRVLLCCGMIIGLSLGGVFLYAKIFRK